MAGWRGGGKVTGPDHYRAAEQLQQHARAVIEATQGPLADLAPEERARMRASDLADAQVHAVLALAAAIGTSADVVDGLEWRKVASPQYR